MTQAQNDAPSTSFSRDVVLKILSESGIHDTDAYLTDEMIRKFGFGGYANLEVLKRSLKMAKSLDQVKRLAHKVDYAAADACRVRTHFVDLTVGSFKPMDWNLCAWDENAIRGKMPNCRKFSRKNRPIELVPIKQKVTGHGFSARGGLRDLKRHGVRPALAQEFACYCNYLGGLAEGIELVGLGSVLIRSNGDSLYGFRYLAFDSKGFRAAEEREKNNHCTDRFFIGVSRD